MKKVILIATSLVALASCSSVNSNNMTSFETQKSVVMNAKDQYVLNLEGKDTKILLVATTGNDAFVRYNGKEIMFKRVVTASGEGFESKENKLYIGLKGNEAFLEVDGKTIIPLNVVGDSKDYDQTNSDYTYNFRGIDNKMGMTVVYDRNRQTANVKIDNTNITLSRVRSGSGLAFSTKDGRIYLGIEGNKAYLETNGIGLNFVDDGLNYNNFSKEKVSMYTFKQGNGEVSLAVMREIDLAGLRFEGKDYVLRRVKTASGEAFETQDKKVYFGVKNYGNNIEGYLEINGRTYRFTNGRYKEL